MLKRGGAAKIPTTKEVGSAQLSETRAASSFFGEGEGVERERLKEALGGW